MQLVGQHHGAPGGRGLGGAGGLVGVQRLAGLGGGVGLGHLGVERGQVGVLIGGERRRQGGVLRRGPAAAAQHQRGRHQQRGKQGNTHLHVSSFALCLHHQA